MRIIKFRIWCTERKEFMTPEGGDYSIGVLSGDIRGIYGEKFPSFIAQQFTGLLDKNGKEIYEGDILKWKSSNIFSINEIRFVRVEITQAQAWCLGIKNIKSYGVYLGELLAEQKCEVIGNTKENPDLL